MADSASTTPASNKPAPAKCSGCWTDLTWAHLVLRVAVGVLLFISGAVKFKSATSPATYSKDYWYGSAAELAEGKSPRMVKIVSLIYQNSGLDNVDKIPRGISNFFGNLFYYFGYALPWVMIGAGLLILIGFCSRLALLAGAACWIMLASGQMILEEQQWVHLLLFFLLLTVATLATLRHNRLALSGIFTSSDS